MSLPTTKAAIRRQVDTPPANVLMLEQHYSIAELAERWSVSHDYVTDLFLDEPGIIRSPRKRSGVIRIPASVVERVYRRMLERAAQ